MECRSSENVLSIVVLTHINNYPEFQNLKFKIPCDMNFELGTDIGALIHRRKISYTAVEDSGGGDITSIAI